MDTQTDREQTIMAGRARINQTEDIAL